MVGTRALVIFLGVVAAGCELTGDGGVGDPVSTPPADVFGTGKRVHDVVGPADDWYEPGNIDSSGCKFPKNRPIGLTGQVIVAIDRFDETGDGATGNIYVQDAAATTDPPTPYSGITVFDPAFTPPDLRVFDGDVVDTFGNLQEFSGPTGSPFGDCRTLPEVGGTMTFRFDGFVPAPMTIVGANGGTPRWDGVKGYANARQWIGSLVRIEGVILAEDGVEDSNGRMSIAMDMGGGISADDVISISNELFDLQGSGLDLATGTTYKSVTGVMTYFFGFKIAPRSVEDFEM
jgi:hypothetical protein